MACNELGDWYRGLADQATTPAGKGAMLERAKAYYQRFVELHKVDDLARDGAALMIKKIDDALEKIGPAAESRPGASTLTFGLGKGVTMKLVRIRPGKFMMGSPDAEKDRRGNEGPQHEVVITNPFYMGVTEVTQTQYDAVMGTNPGTNPSRFKGPANPVEQVNWKNATDFCRKLSEMTHKTFRLPTEAEWEYACRGGSKTQFPFGDSESPLGDCAWYKGNSSEMTHPVAQKKPNARGLYDMIGNVWEWCADWYDSYPTGTSTNPQGATSGGYRVIRGGSWSNDGTGTFRCAFRGNCDPVNRGGMFLFATLGFRCAMTP